jgi:hypothetical protein
MTSIDQRAVNLRAFFAEGVNSVTRERIFFNRLSFDLKIAAARAGYHLHLYEPDVDRDGFDIVVEDQEGFVGWFQLKAVLRSAETSSWDTTAGFILPHFDIGEELGFAPVECGRGGGVILIEIDDSTANGDVVYSYTDFRVLTALAERYLLEKVGKKENVRGRPPLTRQSMASSAISRIRNGKRGDAISLPRKAFVELASPDALLSVMGLWSDGDFAPYSIQQAYAARVEIDPDGQGMVLGGESMIALSNLRYHMRALVGLLGEDAGLRAMDFTSSHGNASRSI